MIPYPNEIGYQNTETIVVRRCHLHHFHEKLRLTVTGTMEEMHSLTRANRSTATPTIVELALIILRDIYA